MKVTQIPFKKTGFFSKTMVDYLDQKKTIQPFYNNYPTIEGFQHQIDEKQKSFSKASRLVLTDALKKQYKDFKVSEKTYENIVALASENTFTITTGHQLNLFTGPLYFLYKIISTINLCEELSENFPSQNFVPIYWMATEDHDFDEINYFNFDGKKVQWNREDGGAVGRFSTKGLDEVFEVFSNHLGSSKNAQYLKELFSNGYLKHNNLADATRFIANELFKQYGLVIVDGDDKSLKELFVPFVKDELQNGTSFKTVSKTIKKLEEHYKIQVNPREINLFYLGDDYRERIIFEDNRFKVNNTEIVFTKEEILNEVDNNPKAFSPNVIMRPLYQEIILPNLCYIGGGGEQAYWLELKDYFNSVNILFPVLLLRNSVQIISEKQARKLEKLNILKDEIFINQYDLISEKVIANSDLKFEFNLKINFLKEQFLDLKAVAKQTDITFLNAVNAQERKQIKGLENLEKRLLKAERKRQIDLVNRITKLQNEILPNQSLEERQRNFSEYYLEYGQDLLYSLKNELHPLNTEFLILEL
jgi:bacillithiol biosynthesis cysteine-adding enzyme BshC